MKPDPVTHQTGSLLARARAANATPKIFFTNDSSEYWGRAASLIHITADGKRDAALSPGHAHLLNADRAALAAARCLWSNKHRVPHESAGPSPHPARLLADPASVDQGRHPAAASVYPKSPKAS